MSLFGSIGDKPTRDGLQDHEERLRALEQPQAPQRLFVTDSTSLALVDPVRFQNCAAWISDLSTVAVSDGSDWIRQDTQGAL